MTTLPMWPAATGCAAAVHGDPSVSAAAAIAVGAALFSIGLVQSWRAEQLDGRSVGRADR